MDVIITNFKFIASGAFLSLALLFCGITIGLIMGTFFSILKYAKICNFAICQFISLIRGTPLMLQLSFSYFVLPVAFNINLDIFTAGIISFGLNSSAYICEILRSGIESIPKAQFEAAKTLQIPNFYMWKDIILPQVFRNIFPAFVNEVIALLKETPLISILGGMDIMRRSQVISAEQFSYFMPLCMAGLCYYFLVITIEFFGNIIEKRIAIVKK